MAFVFGISNSAPDSVLDRLSRSKLIGSPSEVAVHQVGMGLPTKLSSKVKFLFLLTVADVQKHFKALMTSAYKDVHVFVFGAPMKLHDIHGIVPLDYEPNPELPGFGFKMTSLNLSPVRRARTQSQLRRKNGKYLENLLTHVQEGSLLNPLMTAIYGLPSTAQTKVKIAAVSWLYKNKPVSALNASLLDLASKGIKISAAFHTKLTDILTSDAAKKYQLAFSEYRKDKLDTGKAPNIQKIAKQFGVVEYEMTYILSVLRDAKSSRQYGDSFDKARNRMR